MEQERKGENTHTRGNFGGLSLTESSPDFLIYIASIEADVKLRMLQCKSHCTLYTTSPDGTAPHADGTRTTLATIDRAGHAVALHTTSLLTLAAFSRTVGWTDAAGCCQPAHHYLHYGTEPEVGYCRLLEPDHIGQESTIRLLPELPPAGSLAGLRRSRQIDSVHCRVPWMLPAAPSQQTLHSAPRPAVDWSEGANQQRLS